MVGKRIKRAYFFERAYFCSVETEMSPPKDEGGRKPAILPVSTTGSGSGTCKQPRPPSLPIGDVNTQLATRVQRK